MKEQNNSQSLINELKKSANVLSVDRLKEYVGLKEWEKYQVMELVIDKDGYSFELLQSKYPTLEIHDITPLKDNKTQVIIQVKEVQ